MRISDFLVHHGIQSNPFAEEDAQQDIVFQNGCLESARHPAWDKIFGDPELPSTSIVFGEKGSGKTALKIQMTGELEKYNQSHPNEGDYVIQYDNFNPFLDAFQERFFKFRRTADTLLKNWKLWDHIDAILTLGVTKLTDMALEARDANGSTGQKINLDSLDQNQKSDFLLLAALYDQSPSGGQYNRWSKLRHRLGVSNWSAWKYFSMGIGLSALVVTAAVLLMLNTSVGFVNVALYSLIVMFIAFCPWLWRLVTQWMSVGSLWRNMRVRNFDQAPMRQIFLDIPASRLSGQPMPTRAQSDDRYALLEKFSMLTKALGYKSIVILVDRVDEPYLINGSAPYMRSFIWPLLDNKLLKFSGVAFKALLPAELYDFAKKESKEFHERSRLDKQNMIASLTWTGQSLYDLVNARLAACTDRTMKEVPETLEKLFDANMTIDHLVVSLEKVRTPRRVFKFLYELMSEHVQSFTDQNPQWQIATSEFDGTLKRFLREDF